MNVFLLISLGLASLCTAHGYVYVQVQKGDKDMSSVDALIHKQVPSDSVGEIAEQLKDTFHKKTTKHNKYKRFEVRKRADDDQPRGVDSAEKQRPKKPTFPDSMEYSKKTLENVMFAVDTGASPDPPSKPAGGAASDMIDQFLSAVKDFGKEGHPMYRAQEEYNIKPEVVQFRSGKPSLKFEVNSDSIVKLAKELLSSPTIKKYADELAQKAAVLFTVIKDEMKKSN